MIINKFIDKLINHQSRLCSLFGLINGHEATSVFKIWIASEALFARLTASQDPQEHPALEALKSAPQAPTECVLWP